MKEMFKFLQKRHDERKDDQALIADRDRLRAERRQMLCTKHLWRVNRNSPKKQYYPWMLFFVCEHCRKDMAMTRRAVYERMGVQDIDYRVLITMNTQAFINEVEQVMTILGAERK